MFNTHLFQYNTNVVVVYIVIKTHLNVPEIQLGMIMDRDQSEHDADFEYFMCTLTFASLC